MQIRNAEDNDMAGIAAIYNDAVMNTTAIWNDTQVSVQNRIEWLHSRRRSGYPVLVAVDPTNAVLGYASFGDWRAFEGYRFTVEHSVYIHADQRGRGLGEILLRALIVRAREIGKHVMVAGIDTSNAGSIHLHEKLGFAHVGKLPQVGAKFGKWLDLTFMQLTLDNNPYPAQ